MTSFAYTTGNPNNLTAGSAASMNDIQGPLTDLRTFINGANLSDVNLQNAGIGLAKLTPLILYGTINGATGAALAGYATSGGWSGSRSSAGNYTVTFSPAFSIIPAVFYGPINNTASTAYVIEGAPAAGSVSIGVRNPGVGFFDYSFGFFAIGAR